LPAWREGGRIAFAYPKTAVFDRRQHRIVGAFGRLTYAMYVLHVLAMIVVETFLAPKFLFLSPFLRYWIFVLPLTVCSAWLSWQCIEKPFYGLKKKFGVIRSGHDNPELLVS